MNFDDFVKGEILVFYGVWGNEFKLNDTIWEALENPEDGYRSYLDSIEKKESTGIFYRTPICPIVVRKVEERSFNGYEFVDPFTDHLWLRIGSDNFDDWYPCFIFQYTPDTSDPDYTDYDQ